MAINVGDKCPIFTLPNQKGESISIADLIGKKLLVIYFYPKDNTSGCTAEACSFRDNSEVFEEMGCEVVGISSDSISSHEKFAAQHRLNFNLLADTNKVVRKQFGVPGALFGLIGGRVTYVIDKKGYVRSVHNALTDAESHITNAIATITKLVQEEQ